MSRGVELSILNPLKSGRNKPELLRGRVETEDAARGVERELRREEGREIGTDSSMAAIGNGGLGIYGIATGCGNDGKKWGN